jgi:prepilin-type N-terminal cleavage/methylation domain-containing protein
MIERLRAKNGDEGFTLIELLIVIIILAILAAIVVFAIGTTRKDSVASSCKTNFKSVELSAEAVNTKTGSYPTDTTGLTSPATGALLKAFPTSADYSFTITGGGASATVIHVHKSDAAATDVGTTSAACDGL